MNHQQEFLAYKIPFLDTLEPNTIKINQLLTIIGVIDCSGSMENCWEMLADFWNLCIPKDNTLTITFHSSAMIMPNNILQKDIKKHGGGGTDIVEAFELLEKEIEKIPIQSNLTVIFISDGQDDEPKTIGKRIQTKLKGNTQNRALNFICLGVEAGFPTQLAINLREIYHRGDPQIPAVYLIEHVSEQAFFNKFETMKKYFYPTRKLELNRFIKLVPFDEEVTDVVYEGQWVISNKPGLQILLEEKQIDLDYISESQLTINYVISLFKFWVQYLQLKGMGKKQIIPKAEQALVIMERITERLNQQFEINVLYFNIQEINDPSQPFHIRAKRNYIYKYANKLLYFIDEVKSLARGVNPALLGEFEQAKRLNIGTITGQHHQKALALKGITIDEFTKIKEEFIAILNTCKFNPQNDQGQERSVFLLENQRDILLDKDLIDGLQYIRSQYDFAETFPLVGHGLWVKRQEGCQVNPWIVSVEKMAQQNKVIDSAFLIKNNFKVELNTGGNLKEGINCILPLFHESDSDLQPILRSRIMKLLLTFMVQQNVDTLYEETYLALLANALVYMFRQQDSKYKSETINLIYQTTKIVYQGTEKFEGYLIKLINDPPAAFLQREEQYEDYVSTIKPFMYIFYAHMTGIRVDNMFDNLIIYYLIREKRRGKLDIESYLKINLPQQSEAELKASLSKIYSNYISLRHFRIGLQNQLELKIVESLKQKVKEIKIVKDQLYQKDVKLTLNIIEALYEFIFKKKFDQSKYIQMIYHVSKQEEIKAFKSVQYSNEQIIEELISKQDKKHLTRGYGKLRSHLEKEYTKWFVRRHMFVEPLTYDKLVSECQRLNVDVKTIAYNEKSGLSSNCCLSHNCPFYLEVMGLEFKKHIQVWGSKVPNGFHEYIIKCIKKGKSQSQIIEKAHKKWKQFPKFYFGNQETVKQYIDLFKSYINKEQSNRVPKDQLRYYQVKLTFPKRERIFRPEVRKRIKKSRAKQQQGRGRARSQVQYQTRKKVKI